MPIEANININAYTWILNPISAYFGRGNIAKNRSTTHPINTGACFAKFIINTQENRYSPSNRRDH